MGFQSPLFSDLDRGALTILAGGPCPGRVHVANCGFPDGRPAIGLRKSGVPAYPESQSDCRALRSGPSRAPRAALRIGPGTLEFWSTPALLDRPGTLEFRSGIRIAGQGGDTSWAPAGVAPLTPHRGDPTTGLVDFRP